MHPCAEDARLFHVKHPQIDDLGCLSPGYASAQAISSRHPSHSTSVLAHHGWGSRTEFPVRERSGSNPRDPARRRSPSKAGQPPSPRHRPNQDSSPPDRFPTPIAARERVCRTLPSRIPLAAILVGTRRRSVAAAGDDRTSVAPDLLPPRWPMRACLFAVRSAVLSIQSPTQICPAQRDRTHGCRRTLPHRHLQHSSHPHHQRRAPELCKAHTARSCRQAYASPKTWVHDAGPT